jgi:probable phosphoglycerate mutase
MKTVWLVRHAESYGNSGGQTATPQSIELTEAGKQQAEGLADEISNKPDLIITSPFIRTLQTAEPLLAKFPEAKHEQWPVYEFTYICPAKCHNTSMEDRMPLVMEYWDRNDPNYCDGDGAESFFSFINRVANFAKKLKNRPERFIVVFSHYQFIAAYDWFNGLEQSPITAEQMKNFKQYLSSYKLENVGI